VPETGVPSPDVGSKKPKRNAVETVNYNFLDACAKKEIIYREPGGDKDS
jgi:hypothetical protein